MPKLSIIVPVYNVEKYISQCLDSIINQTFKDFEVIMINDGTKDDSVSICEEYLEKDSRFSLYHQKNQGLWSARNTGLLHAKGEWVEFIDSDDYLLVNTALEEIFNHNLEDIDVVRFGCVERINDVPKGNDSFTKKEFFSNAKDKYFLLDTAWSGVFRRQMLVSNNIKFRHLKLGEDTMFHYDVIFAMQKILYIPKAYIFYRNNDESIMNTKFHEHFWETATSFLVTMKQIADKNDYKDPSYEDKILETYYSGLLNEYKSDAKRIDKIENFKKQFNIEKILNPIKMAKLSVKNPRWILAKLNLYSLFFQSHILADRIKRIVKR